jgi:hypothetical protein
MAERPGEPVRLAHVDDPQPGPMLLHPGRIDFPESGEREVQRRPARAVHCHRLVGRPQTMFAGTATSICFG